MSDDREARARNSSASAKPLARRSTAILTADTMLLQMTHKIILVNGMPARQWTGKAGADAGSYFVDAMVSLSPRVASMRLIDAELLRGLLNIVGRT